MWLFGLSCRLCSLASVQSSQLVGFLVRPSGLAIDTVHTAKPVCTAFVGGLSIACGVVSSRSIGWGYVLCVVCGCLLVSWQHQAAWVVCHGSRATQRLGLHINSCTCSAGFFAGGQGWPVCTNFPKQRVHTHEPQFSAVLPVLHCKRPAAAGIVQAVIVQAWLSALAQALLTGRLRLHHWGAGKQGVLVTFSQHVLQHSSKAAVRFL